MKVYYRFVIIWLLLHSFSSASFLRSGKIQDNCAVEVGEEIYTAGNYIGVIFTKCVSQDVLSAVLKGISKWNSLIAFNRLSILGASSIQTNVQQICAFLDSLVINELTFHKRLRIFIEVKEMDGMSDRIATASACMVEEHFHTVFGGIVLNAKNIPQLVKANILSDVIIHETAHVLGFDRIFFQKFGLRASLISGTNMPSLIKNPVVDEFGEIHPNNKPTFLGMSSVVEYSLMQGSWQEGVPLEALVSVDSHWDKDVFGDEIMTHSISNKGPSHPLSTITLSALLDLGYAIRTEMGDTFSLGGKPLLAETEQEHILLKDSPDNWGANDIISLTQFLQTNRL